MKPRTFEDIIPALVMSPKLQLGGVRMPTSGILHGPTLHYIGLDQPQSGEVYIPEQVIPYQFYEESICLSAITMPHRFARQRERLEAARISSGDIKCDVAFLLFDMASGNGQTGLIAGMQTRWVLNLSEKLRRIKQQLS